MRIDRGGERARRTIRGERPRRAIDELAYALPRIGQARAMSHGIFHKRDRMGSPDVAAWLDVSSQERFVSRCGSVG